MDRKKLVIIILSLISSSLKLRGQHEVIESLIFDRAIENLLPSQEYDVDYNDLYDRLFSLYTNPINLNSADRNEFHSIFFLTETQVDAIMEYRQKYGDFLSIYELTYIDGIDEKTVQSLMSFVSVFDHKNASLRESLNEPDIHEFFLRHQTVLETKKGYTPPDTTSSGGLTSRYLGDPHRLYSRYLLAKKGRYSLGFTLEKDPGEQLIWDPETNRYGMDYYAFHVMLENAGFVKKILIGDFSADFGQGLIYGSGIRVGKGAEPNNTVRRNNLGFRPYRSVYENKDFSGIAISTKFKLVELNAFYSIINRDGIRQSDSLSGHEQFVSYIQTIGQHRTPSELLAKDRIQDRSFGGNINFKSRNGRFELGANALVTSYNVPLVPDTKIYNQFQFSGISNQLGGIYANYFFKNAHAFAEVAMSESGGKAISSGVIVSPVSQVQASMHFRDYAKDYHSFYGNAFGENVKISNEKGLFWGLKLQPVRTLELTAYFDFFQFPWLKYRVVSPSHGSELMVSTTWQVNPELDFRIQYRSKSTEVNFREGDEPIDELLPKKIERWLFHMNYRFRDRFSVHTRVQQSHVDFNGEHSVGFILAQDAVLKYPSFAISARFAVFDADTYDARQFIYERDLLYVYSFPSFYNQGIRCYLITSFELFRRITLWFKIGQTRYFGVDSIGSGLEKIIGNKKTNIGTQIRIRL